MEPGFSNNCWRECDPIHIMMLDNHYHPMWKLTYQGYPALIYAIIAIIQTTSEWGGTPLILSGKVSLQVHEPQNCWPEKKQVCNTEVTSLKARCFTELDSSVSITYSSTSQHANYKEECLICGRTCTTKSDWSLLLICTLDTQKSIWDNAKELGDEDMLHRICGSDNKCSTMVADDFQHHLLCCNAYMMTRRVHSQERHAKLLNQTHIML